MKISPQDNNIKRGKSLDKELCAIVFVGDRFRTPVTARFYGNRCTVFIYADKISCQGTYLCTGSGYDKKWLGLKMAMLNAGVNFEGADPVDTDELMTMVARYLYPDAPMFIHSAHP